ncbi:MAG: PQQ-binding-like beta-propeller repeat protein [Candidatus Zixiibacteriota bacterium]
MKSRILIAAVASLTLVSLVGCASKYRLERFKVQEGAQWPYHRGDAQSTGSVLEGAFDGKLDVIWEYRSNDKPAGPLTVYHNRLIYPGARHKIKFIDMETGHFEGQIKSGGNPQTGVVVADSLAYFAISPRTNLLKCVNLRNGDIIWERPFVNASNGGLLVDDLLVIGSSIGDLMALSQLSGEVKWRFLADMPLAVAPTFAMGKIFQPGGNGMLFALSPLSGKLVWKVKLENAIAAAVSAGEFVYAGDLDGFVYAINSDDGSIVWKRQVGGPVWTSPAVAEGRIFVGHSGGEMVALDAISGEIIWRFDAADVVRSSAVVVGGYVVFGNASGMLFSLDALTGRLVEERQLDGPIVAAPVTNGQNVVVATDEGLVVCLGDAPQEPQAQVSDGD